MPTNFEWMRDRLMSKVMSPCVGDLVEPLDSLKATEWSLEFEQLMRNRLLMGRFRYAPMRSPEKGAYDNVGSAQKRLRLYLETGNVEHLVDVANLCLIEFEHGCHPERHFAASDDGEHVPRI